MGKLFLQLKRYQVGAFILTVLSLLSAMQVQAATVAAEVIKAAVTGYVEKSSRWPAGCVRVSFRSHVADEELPVSAVSLRVTSRPGEDFLDYSALTVGFYSAGKLLRERSVSVSMEVLTDVVVSARSLPRNQIIQSGDMYVQKRWLKRVPTNLATLSEAAGKVLTMTLGANREITRNLLSEPTLVKRGKVVRILLDNDVLMIAAIGLSEEEGRKNQIIRVKNLSSNRVIYAKVTGGDTVRVDF